MKLASGFCIPETLPVHTGIKRRQVHPLIRFLLRSRVYEKSADLHKAFHLCFVPGWRESLSSAIPLGTSTKRANSKRANHGRSCLFQDAVSSLHINCLELWEVHLALRQFQPLMLGKHVLVRMDNTAAVSYINRLGGIRSHRMSQLARHLLLWSPTRALFGRTCNLISQGRD